MVGIRAVGKGFQEHGTDPLGKERGQLPRTAQGDHDAQGLAKGNAPPCGAPTGLSSRILLQVQPELHEGGHIRQPDAAHGKHAAMLYKKY